MCRSDFCPTKEIKVNFYHSFYHSYHSFIKFLSQFYHIIFITKFLSNLYHSSYQRGAGITALLENHP